MNAAKKIPTATATTKKIQLALPQSPADSPATSPTAAEKHSSPVEAKQNAAGRHLAANKKESLESLKKHQVDKKRQRQQDLQSTENGEFTEVNIADQQQPNEPPKSKHKGKSPYDILFDQNQHLANELEVQYS